MATLPGSLTSKGVYNVLSFFIVFSYYYTIPNSHLQFILLFFFSKYSNLAISLFTLLQRCHLVHWTVIGKFEKIRVKVS